MLIVNQNNFSLRMMQKYPDSATAPKNTFYGDFRICLALEGEAVWEIEDRSYRICPGDVIFLNIGQKRRFTSFGENGFRLCTFKLTRDAFSGIRHFMFFLDRIKRGENVYKSCAFSPCLQSICDGWQEEETYRYEYASAKLTEFFILAERAARFSFQPLTKTQRYLFDLMDQIDAELTEGIDLSAAAKRAGMTESTFSRHFSALNGISFKRYVTEKRIRHAIYLLEHTDLKMLDVALGSGFDSVSGFYEAFKKKTGTTPARYLKNEKKETR